MPEDKPHKNIVHENMEDKINIAREKLEINFPLKEKQMETLQYRHGMCFRMSSVFVLSILF
jgi:hypothetical protein